MPMLGHVTSSYFSSNCGRSIAMAMVKNGRARMGETLWVTTPSGFTEAVVAPAVFHQVQGAKADA